VEGLEPGSGNLDAAVQFMRRAGSPVELARLDYLLTGSPPVPELGAVWCGYFIHAQLGPDCLSIVARDNASQHMRRCTEPYLWAGYRLLPLELATADNQPCPVICVAIR
jgi:hypothetical protein